MKQWKQSQIPILLSIHIINIDYKKEKK